jgi:hypothetical protein
MDETSNYMTNPILARRRSDQMAEIRAKEAQRAKSDSAGLGHEAPVVADMIDPAAAPPSIHWAISEAFRLVKDIDATVSELESRCQDILVLPLPDVAHTPIELSAGSMLYQRILALNGNLQDALTRLLRLEGNIQL